MVDDDPEMGAALKAMLRLLDYDLRLFNDARHSARALITDSPPNVIFIDLNMPEVTGIDLLDFIRSRPRWKNLPVIILSAETADLTVANAYKHGADAYLFKPVSLEELSAGIRKALQKQSL